MPHSMQTSRTPCPAPAQPDQDTGTLVDGYGEEWQRLRLSEERYRLAAEAGSDGIYDWDLRTDTIYYSSRWKESLGLADAQVGTSPEEWFRRVHPDDLIWLRATFDAQVSAGGKPFRIEYRMRDSQGQERWMLCRGRALLDDAGEPKRIVGSQTDITDTQRAREALRLSEERYALAAAGSNGGLWDWDVGEDRLFCSGRWSEILGSDMGAREFTIGDWYAQIKEEDRLRLRTAIADHLSGLSGHLEEEVRARHSNGGEVWVEIRGVAVRDDAGHPVRMAGSLIDITARKRAEQQIQFDSFHDRLTRLPNRMLLSDRVGQALARRHRQDGRPFALMLIDLNRFKTINDSLGSVAGDEVLRIAAERLEQCRPDTDTVARLAADQFGVLVNDIANDAAAIAAAEGLAATIAQPIDIADGQSVLLSCSVGVVLSEDGYTLPADMLRDAALAMYRAKAGGTTRIEMFDRSLRERAISRLRLESDLRHAVDKGEFHLVYQPIVSLANNMVAGFEALLRWSHPERGIIPPGDFIQLAEETGLILKIGTWVMEEAARQLKIWQERYSPTLFMSVNVSGRQMMEDDIVATVAGVLRRHPVTPGTLKLEITESMLLDEPGRYRMMMEALVALGVKLCLDDFGTGFSSLNYLHRYPVATLKIDRSFVRTLGEQDRRAAIPRVMVHLAEAMGMEVIAEGIERQLEADHLRTLNCAYGQGFFYARPLRVDAAEPLLDAQAALKVSDGDIWP